MLRKVGASEALSSASTTAAAAAKDKVWITHITKVANSSSGRLPTAAPAARTPLRCTAGPMTVSPFLSRLGHPRVQHQRRGLECTESPEVHGDHPAKDFANPTLLPDSPSCCGGRDEVPREILTVGAVAQILPLDFSHLGETAELTETQKLKRPVVVKKYAKEIDAMYSGKGGENVKGPAP